MYPAHNFALAHWKQDRPSRITRKRPSTVTSEVILRKALHGRCEDRVKSGHEGPQQQGVTGNVQTGSSPIQRKTPDHQTVDEAVRPKTCKPPRLNLKQLQKFREKEEQDQQAPPPVVKHQKQKQSRAAKSSHLSRSRVGSVLPGERRRPQKPVNLKPISVKKLFDEVEAKTKSRLEKGQAKKKEEAKDTEEEALQKQATSLAEKQFMRTMTYKRALYEMITQP